MVQNPPENAGDIRDVGTQETQAPSLGQEDPLEKEMAPHSSVLAWKIPDRGAWQATVYGVAESDMTEQLTQEKVRYYFI